MTMHTHACTFCTQQYVCDAPLVRNDDGWPEVVCVTRMEADLDYQSCQGCRENGCCEDCGKAPATGDGHKPFLCEPCEENWLDNYSGPEDGDSGGVSIAELSERAYHERAELRRRD